MQLFYRKFNHTRLQLYPKSIHQKRLNILNVFVDREFLDPFNFLELLQRNMDWKNVVKEINKDLPKKRDYILYAN